MPRNKGDFMVQARIRCRTSHFALDGVQARPRTYSCLSRAIATSFSKDRTNRQHHSVSSSAPLTDTTLATCFVRWLELDNNELRANLLTTPLRFDHACVRVRQTRQGRFREFSQSIDPTLLYNLITRCGR